MCAPGRVVAVFKSFDSIVRPAKNGNRISKEERKKEKAKLQSLGKGNEANTKTKVDVVAERGMRWIRVNTYARLFFFFLTEFLIFYLRIKNNRILSEFREIDSYLTDESDSDDEYEHGPTLAQKEFDNSLLKMGRALTQAAAANPVHGKVVPKVTMRLTRLNPNEPDVDSRIAYTIECLRGMGIDVELGEREGVMDGMAGRVPSPSSPNPSSSTSPRLRPTRKINLDLSVLIALVSDLTHAALPSSVEDASARFIPPPERIREWKNSKPPGAGSNDDELQHSRQLTNQVMQEMVKGMLQEMKERVSVSSELPADLEFYTTEEAHERCLRIVDKIGGPSEKHRARSLFLNDQDAYWAASRYGAGFVPLMPLKYHQPSDVPARADAPLFFRALEKTCEDILALEPSVEKEKAKAKNDEGDEDVEEAEEPLRIDGLGKSNIMRGKRLTAHTVRSLLWGAKKGWTTLTANRTSVRAVMSEINARRTSDVEGVYEYEEAVGSGDAAIWIVDPRSLAEEMRNDFQAQADVTI